MSCRVAFPIALVALFTACRSNTALNLAAGRWQGVVEVPGTLHRHIELRVFASGDRLMGELGAPGSGLRAQRVKIDERSGTIDFTVPAGGSDVYRFNGRLLGDEIAGRITGMPRLGTFHLRRRAGPLPAPIPATPEPRWPGAEWERGDTRAAGFDLAALERALAITAAEMPEVRAVLVARHGRLVVERYFAGAAREQAWNTKSVTKSVVSALVGIALAEGRLPGLDTALPRLLPERAAALRDERPSAIALRDLLAMTTGWRWEENGPTTSAWLASSDRVGFMLELPIDAPPGQRFGYSTGVAHLLTASLRAAGVAPRAFAEARLLGPIDARLPRWDGDGQGIEEGGSELYLTARDMLRFGHLYLHRGRWREQQVVPAAWVDASTRAQSRRDPFWADYGYLWWLEQDDDLASFTALGYGGQAIHVVPALDLVIVVASTTREPRDPLRRLLHELLVPALRGSDPMCPLLRPS